VVQNRPDATPSPSVPPGKHDSAAGLRAAADAWLAQDPDPDTRAELTAVLDALPGSADDLADRFAASLTFGTAGLRGPVRAGPNGMNRAVVRAAAAGLVSWLDQQGEQGPIVIGYDARHGSAAFAEETARVVTGAGRVALMLPEHLPTPVLAYAVTHVTASGAVVPAPGPDSPAAGVMVTASHNPPQDNGYKVYLGARLGGAKGAGAQIVPPVDTEIEAAIRDVGPLADVPLGPLGTVLGEEIVEAYIRDATAAVEASTPRELTIAYTPMHGVGGQVAAAAFTAAGFTRPMIVPAQEHPDPDFPTVSFPNPEEPGAMDLVIALASEVGADIAIANDPDADRCAVAVPDRHGNWRALRGDELGILLADHLMRRGVRGLYATTIVSSSLLQEVCARRGLPYAETLTGFKWVVRAGTGDPLVFGYEEALGYCVAPSAVRDKDGISAALVAAELAAGLKREQRTVGERLDEIAAEFGVYATEQVAIRVDDLAEIGVLMERIRTHPPTALLDVPIESVEDLLPDNDVLILRTPSARVVFRPSGTEPKLKAYLQIIGPVVDGDVASARDHAAAAISALHTEITGALAIS
jgi:phosphomannomutase